VPWRALVVATLVLGAALGLGARASLANHRESSPPEGWTFARADNPAARVISAGELPPSPHQAGLSALQGITRTFAEPLAQVAVDVELPEDGVIQVQLDLTSMQLLRPTMVFVAGTERSSGGRVIAYRDRSGPAPMCTPTQVPAIAPGRHRLEFQTLAQLWLVMVDGVPVLHCQGVAINWREVTITPGQDRILLHTFEVSGGGTPVSQAFADGSYARLIAVGALSLLAVGAALSGLIARGHRLAVAVAALSPLLLALPLSAADLRVAAARFRLLPEAANNLPWLLPAFLALFAVAHLPSPPGSAPWRVRVHDWLVGGGVLAALAAVARAGWPGVPPVVVLAVAVLVAGRVATPASAFERVFAVGAPLYALALAAEAEWSGHLVGAAALVGVAGLTPVVGRAARPATPPTLALLGICMLASLEFACRGGPQADAWTAGSAAEARTLDPAATSGQSFRAAIIDSEDALARNCTSRAMPARPNARRVAVYGGSSTAPTDVSQYSSFYPALLERIWNQHFPQAPLQVVNQGVPGWTTNEIANCVEKLAGELSAKLSIFYVGRNDTVGFVGVKDGSSGITDGSTGALAGALERFALLRAAHFAMLGTWFDGAVSPAPTPIARANLERVADAVRAAGGNTLLLSEATFPGTKTYAPYRAMLQEFADERDDVAFLDTAAIIGDHLDPSLFLDEVHLSSTGHLALAMLLAEQLAAHPDWLPRAEPSWGSRPGAAPASGPQSPGLSPGS